MGRGWGLTSVGSGYLWFWESVTKMCGGESIVYHGENSSKHGSYCLRGSYSVT